MIHLFAALPAPAGVPVRHLPASPLRDRPRQGGLRRGGARHEHCAGGVQRAGQAPHAPHERLAGVAICEFSVHIS